MEIIFFRLFHGHTTGCGPVFMCYCNQRYYTYLNPIFNGTISWKNILTWPVCTQPYTSSHTYVHPTHTHAKTQVHTIKNLKKQRRILKKCSEWNKRNQFNSPEHTHTHTNYCNDSSTAMINIKMMTWFPQLMTRSLISDFVLFFQCLLSTVSC